MSDEEVDELLKAVDTSSGEINYTGMPSQERCCVARNRFDQEQNLSAQSWQTNGNDFALVDRGFQALNDRVNG